MFKNLMSKIEKIEMKKIVVCVVSLALVATIACVAVGCKDAKSSDNSSNPSGAVVENDSAAAEDEVIYETVYVDENGNEIEKPDETVYENEENVESETVENEEVVSSEPVVSKPTEPVVSTPVIETPSEGVSSEEIVNNDNSFNGDYTDAQIGSANEDCIDTTTPNYPTLVLYKKTTYCGFQGYFSNVQSTGDNRYDILEVSENTLLNQGITEYYNIDDGTPIWFIYTSDQGINRILVEKIESEKGVDKFSIPVYAIE